METVEFKTSASVPVDCSSEDSSANFSAPLTTESPEQLTISTVYAETVARTDELPAVGLTSAAATSAIEAASPTFDECDSTATSSTADKCNPVATSATTTTAEATITGATTTSDAPMATTGVASLESEYAERARRYQKMERLLKLQEELIRIQIAMSKLDSADDDVEPASDERVETEPKDLLDSEASTGASLGASFVQEQPNANGDQISDLVAGMWATASTENTTQAAIERHESAAAEPIVGLSKKSTREERFDTETLRSETTSLILCDRNCRLETTAAKSEIDSPASNLCSTDVVNDENDSSKGVLVNVAFGSPPAASTSETSEHRLDVADIEVSNDDQKAEESKPTDEDVATALSELMTTTTITATATTTTIASTTSTTTTTSADLSTTLSKMTPAAANETMPIDMPKIAPNVLATTSRVTLAAERLAAALAEISTSALTQPAENEESQLQKIGVSTQENVTIMSIASEPSATTLTSATSAVDITSTTSSSTAAVDAGNSVAVAVEGQNVSKPGGPRNLSLMLKLQIEIGRMQLAVSMVQDCMRSVVAALDRVMDDSFD